MAAAVFHCFILLIFGEQAGGPLCGLLLLAGGEDIASGDGEGGAAFHLEAPCAQLFGSCFRGAAEQGGEPSGGCVECDGSSPGGDGCVLGPLRKASLR